MIDIFTKGGYEVTTYPTQGQGDAISAVFERGGQYEIIACCGGDGTLDETVSGMLINNFHYDDQHEKVIHQTFRSTGNLPKCALDDLGKSVRFRLWALRTLR